MCNPDFETRLVGQCLLGKYKSYTVYQASIACGNKILNNYNYEYL